MINFLKKYKVLLIIMLSILVCLQIFFWIQEQPRKDLLYVQEYMAGTGNIKGDVDTAKWSALGEEFAIGANKDGYAVFKEPQKAMNTICRDYRMGIRAMQREGAPWGFRYNYEAYPDYALSISSGSEAKRQADIVAGFVDIYENSFNSSDLKE